MRETYNKIIVIRKWHYDLAVHSYNEKIADRCLSQRKLTTTSLFPTLVYSCCGGLGQDRPKK